jgi:hypothetical protein
MRNLPTTADPSIGDFKVQNIICRVRNEGEREEGAVNNA